MHKFCMLALEICDAYDDDDDEEESESEPGSTGAGFKRPMRRTTHLLRRFTILGGALLGFLL